jgi:hypothetical protein
MSRRAGTIEAATFAEFCGRVRKDIREWQRYARQLAPWLQGGVATFDELRSDPVRGL